MFRYSFLVWMAAGSVALAADTDGDGCQDEFAANGACVDVNATVDGTSTVGANASVREEASIGPEVALGSDVVVAARASLAGRVAHSSNPLSIGAGTIIGRGAQLGAGHMIGDDVTISRSVIAGARLTVAAGGSLGYAAQVGDDVNIGADAVVGNLVTLGDFTTLGDNAVVARSVTIADGINSGDGASVNGIVGPDVIIAAGSRIEQGARVRKQSDIGAGAAIESGGRVGRGAVIEAGATVYGRVAANATVGAGATVEDGSLVSRGGELCAGNTLPTGSQVLGDGTWPVEGCVMTSTCQTIKTSNPSAADGVYSIDPDGLGGLAAFDAYCDMTTDGGGWTLVLNLASGEGGRHDWNDSAFWTAVTTDGTAANAMTNDYKGTAFDQVTANTELMVYVHDEGTTEYGFAVYPLLGAHTGKTFRTLMNSGNNFVPVSDASVRTVTNPVGTHLNARRGQTLHGDIFVNHAGALSLNDTAGWAAAQNLTRIGTTLTNVEYSHTFAGLGIDHIHSGWGADVESAPISAYCAIEHGYGGTSQAVANGQSSFPYQASCTGEGPSFTWLPVDHAIFVR
jgi:UDP-3-O-[3-hydroxymyristoyl] glucosamine N-acyltransferase